jgi:RNA polymerase sigma-70 factor (ECF subfamily)
MAEQDESLLERARGAAEGDLRAFEELVTRHRRGIVANCRHITRNPNDAEDLAQEVFVKAYFGMDRFEGRSTVRHWLQTIKVNHCLNHLKKQAGKQHVDLEDDSLREAPQLSTPAVAEKQAEAGSERRIIQRVLDSMSETVRIPLVLRDMDDWSYEEIAQALGIGLSAVKMRIKRGREEFRSRYAEMSGQARAV